jgi:hypothetical protein
MGRLSSLVGELRQRRVVRALLAYGAGVAVVLQVADMVSAALALPDLAYRIVVIAAIAGFPVVAILSWVYDLTAEGLRRTLQGVAGDRAPVPLARYLQLVGAFTVTAAIVFATAGAVSRLRYPSSDDGRVGLAIFPLRVVGASGSPWSEGAADLLATALDGTASLRVVDPWSLWSPLRPEPGSAARTPDPDEAADLSEGVGAHRFLLGSVVSSGRRIEASFRLYLVGRAEPLDAFTVDADADSMAAAVRRASVRVLARVWGPSRPPDLPSELDFETTQSPEALKAYLAAKEAMRRGMLDSANTAIDRALTLDSTFVLAILEAVLVKSWAQSVRGAPFSGFMAILARADSVDARLDERSRLRLDATRASVRTDGPAALDAATRILELDPLDYGANADLEYFRRILGWQLTPPAYGSAELAERVVRLDCTPIPALCIREWWALSEGDTLDLRHQLRRIEAADTTGTLGRSAALGARAVLAGADAFTRMLPGLARLPRLEFVPVLVDLRIADLSRAERLLATAGAAEDAPMRAGAVAEGRRVDVARGLLASVDSALAAGDDEERMRLTPFLVAADLAGTGNREVAARAVASLSAVVPVDSARALFQERPVWWYGWLVGAWQAQFGDSAVARRWIDALGTLPAGGTSQDYRGALAADIEARLASRRGDAAGGLARARKAVELWTIHAEQDFESRPSPMMRLNLGLLLRRDGRPDEATAVLSSLVPPTTWLGFVTARASYELGDLAAARGDARSAAFHFRRALAFWDGGGPAVSDWTGKARAGLVAAETSSRRGA